MAKKIKAIANENRVASVFAADGLTAQQAIADAVAHGVHNGRYALVAEAIAFGARRATNSKSALYAVWCSLVEQHYGDNGVYDDETCGRALCNALKAAGLRGETQDATAAKCRAWLSSAVKAENERRQSEKERLAAEEAARKALRMAELEVALRLEEAEALRLEEAEALRLEEAEALRLEEAEAMRIAVEAEALRIAVEAEAAEIARTAALDKAKVANIARVSETMRTAAAVECGIAPTKPKRGAVKKDSTKAASPRKPRAPRKAA